MVRNRQYPPHQAAPTPLQLAILREKAAGKAENRIARVLNISERTVRRQLDDLSATLGVNGRFSLFIEVGRRGWLDRADS